MITLDSAVQGAVSIHNDKAELVITLQQLLQIFSVKLIVAEVHRCVNGLERLKIDRHLSRNRNQEVAAIAVLFFLPQNMSRPSCSKARWKTKKSCQSSTLTLPLQEKMGTTGHGLNTRTLYTAVVRLNTLGVRSLNHREVIMSCSHEAVPPCLFSDTKQP